MGRHAPLNALIREIPWKLHRSTRFENATSGQEQDYVESGPDLFVLRIVVPVFPPGQGCQKNSNVPEQGLPLNQQQ